MRRSVGLAQKSSDAQAASTKQEIRVVQSEFYINQMKKAPANDPLDYTLAIKSTGHSAKPWRWEINLAGKSKPVRKSESFGTMSEAIRAGKAALGELRAKQAA